MATKIQIDKTITGSECFSLASLLERAANHVMDSGLELDDVWNDAYENATRILYDRVNAFRAAGHQRTL